MEKGIFKQKNQGFSLVELIVVIAIMAILVGVAVPVYTSYIEKANVAKDEQLLGEINSAFMVAAVDNQVDFDALTAENNKITVATDGTITFELYTNAEKGIDLNATVASVLPGTHQFKVIEAVYYNKFTHQFEVDAVVETTYRGGVVRLSTSDIKMFKNSAFYTADGLGVDDLMDKVNYVAGFASTLDSELYFKILGTREYMETFLNSMGEKTDDTMSDDVIATKFQAIYGDLVEKKAASVCTHGTDGAAVDPIKQCETCMSSAGNAVCANAAVLHAANNTNQTSEELLNTLQNGDNTKTKLLELMNNGKEAEGLAQASAAYGLYVSYAYSLPEGEARTAAIEATKSPIDIMNNLNDPGFQAYLGKAEAKADLEGYLAAMNMMSDSTENNAVAVESLLLNGFSDSELKTALGTAIGENQEEN